MRNMRPLSARDFPGEKERKGNFTILSGYYGKNGSFVIVFIIVFVSIIVYTPLCIQYLNAHWDEIIL